MSPEEFVEKHGDLSDEDLVEAMDVAVLAVIEEAQRITRSAIDTAGMRHGVTLSPAQVEVSFDALRDPRVVEWLKERLT